MSQGKKLQLTWKMMSWLVWIKGEDGRGETLLASFSRHEVAVLVS